MAFFANTLLWRHRSWTHSQKTKSRFKSNNRSVLFWVLRSLILPNMLPYCTQQRHSWGEAACVGVLAVGLLFRWCSVSESEKGGWKTVMFGRIVGKRLAQRLFCRCHTTAVVRDIGPMAYPKSGSPPHDGENGRQTGDTIYLRGRKTTLTPLWSTRGRYQGGYSFGWLI